MEGVRERLAEVGSLLDSPLVGDYLGRLCRQQIRRHGMVFDVSSPVVPPQVKARLFWNTHEAGLIRLLRRHLDPRLDCVELGAAVGVVTCVLRKRLHRERRLIAVEPHPGLAECVQTNLRQNGLEDGVTLLGAAVVAPDDRGLPLELRAPPPHDLTQAYLAPRERAPRGLPVESVTLAEILAENRVGPFTLVCALSAGGAGLILRSTEALKRCRALFLNLGRAATPRSLPGGEAESIGVELGLQPVAAAGSCLYFDRDATAAPSVPSWRRR